MKRLITLAVLSLAAVPMFVLSAGAQSTVTGSDVDAATARATTEAITAKMTAKRDRTRPYTFTTVGKIEPPPRFCAGNTAPTAPTGVANCLPLICPKGSTNPGYCVQPPLGVICSGTVTIRFQKGKSTISSRSVLLKPDCTYTSRVSFRTRSNSRKGVFRVRARFQGNVLLTSVNSPIRTVRAG